jgi:hypothetical protein
MKKFLPTRQRLSKEVPFRFFRQKTAMAFQPQPRHENHGKNDCFFGYEGKERRQRGDDFNVEKGEGIFLP